MGVFSFTRLSPAFVVFASLSAFGVLMVLFSGGLLGVWVGLECSFMGVVCMLSGESVEENESCMKYFVFQAIGSTLMIVGFMFLIEGGPLAVGWFFLFFGLCAKMGFFPFHYWVPSVMGGCSWFGCFIVSVWQKIGPMCFIANCGISFELSYVMEIVAVVTGLLGGVGGIGLLYYRALLGYSSLVHSGWMIMATMAPFSVVLVYLVIYGVVSGTLMYRLFSSKLMCFVDFCNISHDKVGSLYLIFMDFVSLAGLPPLPGFVPKVVVLSFLWPVFSFGLAMLIGASLLSLYYYLTAATVAAVGSGINSYVVISAAKGKGKFDLSWVWNGSLLLAGLVFLWAYVIVA
nr:NADH dehydrogenase subunit 2 [Kuphus sp. PMS-3700M]